MSSNNTQKRLRKQPKRRRVQSTSAVNMPQLNLPKTAQKRRRRKQTEPVRFGLNTLKRFIFSARWLSLGLLAVTIYALVDIYDAQRFYLTYIPVEGAVSISPNEIAAASGLAGSHVFAVDPSAAAQAINDLPGVISSTVTLTWPNEIFISVVEEAPIAIWVENGKEYGITTSGRLIQSARANPSLLRIESEIPAQAPVQSGDATPSELADSGQNNGAGEEIQAALATDSGQDFIPSDVINGAMQLKELRPSIEKLYYQPTGGLSYQDGRGWRGYFGTGAQMNQKLAVYEAVVADLLVKGVQPQYVSVSNQEKPYYRAVGAPQTLEEEPLQ